MRFPNSYFPVWPLNDLELDGLLLYFGACDLPLPNAALGVLEENLAYKFGKTYAGMLDKFIEDFNFQESQDLKRALLSKKGRRESFVLAWKRQLPGRPCPLELGA